ncbi:23424_t:CDS:2, partial [Dentiscutata erythropus]
KQFAPHSALLNRVTHSSATGVYPLNPTITTNNNPQMGTINNTQYLYSPSTESDIPFESLEKWRETLAMILANRSPGDNQAITVLGDMLKECGWIQAACVCYILSPQTSLHSGIDTPNSRFTLVCHDHFQDPSFKDLKALRLSEIYEFGLSLKSNEGGLPFLQPYKLLYAWWLADFGYLNEARR